MCVNKQSWEKEKKTFDFREENCIFITKYITAFQMSNCSSSSPGFFFNLNSYDFCVACNMDTKLATYVAKKLNLQFIMLVSLLQKK